MKSASRGSDAADRFPPPAYWLHTLYPLSPIWSDSITASSFPFKNGDRVPIIVSEPFVEYRKEVSRARKRMDARSVIVLPVIWLGDEYLVEKDIEIESLLSDGSQTYLRA